jgi:hypothetical protein
MKNWVVAVAAVLWVQSGIADVKPHIDFLTTYEGKWKGEGFYWTRDEGYQRIEVTAYCDRDAENEWTTQTYAELFGGGWKRNMVYTIRGDTLWIQRDSGETFASFISGSSNHIRYQIRESKLEGEFEVHYELRIKDDKLESRITTYRNFQHYSDETFTAKKKIF